MGKSKRAASLNLHQHHDVLFGIMDKFFRKHVKVPEIARWVTEQLKAADPSRGDQKVSSQRIYQLMQEMAAKDQFVVFDPPLKDRLARELSDTFDPSVNMRVVNVVQDHSTADHLAAETAKLLLRLIRDVKRATGEERVHIGFGSGNTTRKVAVQLGRRLETEMDMPPLTIHALSNGYVEQPMSAPMSFLSYFTRAATPVKFVGLISAAAVEWNNYEQTKKLVGVRESFRHKDEISIMVSSLASADDEHSLLNCLLNPEQNAKMPKPLRELHAQGLIGDLQFLPYNVERPIKIKTGVRAMTLFELEEMADFITKPHRHSVIVCGRCHQCWKSKARAVRPLISGIAALRVCSHLVTDVATAKELIGMGPI